MNPAPYAAFLGLENNRAILSASPEQFLRIDGHHIATAPIKGTRPRGTTQLSDEALASELVESPKDRAELSMIVDLLRNDIGKAVRKQTAQLGDVFAEFEKTAAALVGHAENITALRREIAEKNAKLHAGNRADLCAINQLSERAQATGQVVIDPLAGLAIAGRWPHTRPKTLALAKAG